MSEREYIEQQLRQVYTVTGVQTWMRGRHQLLGEARPIDLIEAGEAERVMQVVEQLVGSAHA